MKEFFFECLRDLKDIYGVNHMHWLMQECKDQQEFDKKKNQIVESLLIVSQKFDYIPEEKQQIYIRKMMVEDQNYDSLNSRVIWKWLDMHKNNHITHSQFNEDDLSQHPPATDEQVKHWTKLFYENLEKIGNPEFQNGMKEIRKRSGFEVSLSANQPRPEWVVGEVCPECKGDGIQSAELDDSIEPQPCAICEGTGKIDRMVVNAISQEEADKAYKASMK